MTSESLNRINLEVTEKSRKYLVHLKGKNLNLNLVVLNSSSIPSLILFLLLLKSLSDNGSLIDWMFFKSSSDFNLWMKSSLIFKVGSFKE